MSKDRHALLGITEAIQAIEQYTAAFSSADELFESKVNFDAVMMNFILIGEMVERISDAFKMSHTEVDWKQIKGLRNIIAHDYFGVDAEEIWQIIRGHLPGLKTALSNLMNSF
jgi:uncharacterized protein with HEPN domain